MIERYTRPEMGAIWELQNKYQKWLDVELAVCEVQMERGVIPREDWENIRTKAKFTVERVDEIEAVVNHDIIAFLTNVAEYVGPSSRYIHKGMTSSDVLDTATALQLKQASAIILTDLEKLGEALKKQAITHKHSICMGRSHGIHAEPTTFGLKCALWYDENKRNIARFKEAAETVRFGMVSGAVGTFAHLEPEVEEMTCAKLGLKPAPISTQVIQRDNHAHYLSTLAIIAATLEKIAIEIRHLQRTEVLEAEEFFSKGQKGSSAMPHKRNPIVCEQLTGLARLLRSNAMAAIENVALWHERDISHSSVERIILPDSTILIDHMLSKAIRLIDHLLVYPEHMKINMEKTKGLYASQTLLLKLIDKGITREDAYARVQAPAMACWKSGEDFETVVLKDPKITELLSQEEIRSCFDTSFQLRHIDHIYKRVGIENVS